MKTARRLSFLRAIFGAAFALAAPLATAATITVNSTADVVANDGACTLREAITSANSDTASGAAVGECAAGSGADSIQFNIGSGTPSIAVTSQLPDITQTVTIDGGAGPGGATRVEINGSGAGDASGFSVSANATAIRRMVVNRFKFDGIFLNADSCSIQGNFIGTDAAGSATGGFANGRHGVYVHYSSNNHIGGTTGTTPGGSCTGTCNVISGNAQDGIFIEGFQANPGTNTLIEGNYIGTDVTGSFARGNNVGIRTFNNAANTYIGGTSASARNVISGNSNGILINGGGSSGSVVEGNFIGTNSAGTAKLANGIGIRFFAAVTNIRIGGSTAGAGNVISGNNTAGISQTSSSFGAASNVTIQGNYIGTDVTGTLDLGNGAGDGSALNARGGISLTDGAANNTIGGTAAGAPNVIAFNTGAGVRLGASNGGGNPPAAAGNLIRGNVFYENDGLGIALSDGGGINGTPLPNDDDDPDTGANNRQNYPVLTSASQSGGMVTVSGTLNSLPNTTFAIDYYVSADADPSGHGEGETFKATQTVTTNANGDAPLSASFAADTGKPFVTAIATNVATSDTSEFSATALYPNPGNFVFSSASLNVEEDTPGFATITVTRVNGSLGTVTVQYATSNGTATAGEDYTQTSGTLTFADGETSKTFNVPILDDESAEAQETINLTLSAPTGGSALGRRNTAVLTILEDDPAQTFVVNSTADTDDGACTVAAGGCTLREAINAANATTNLDEITFDLGSGTPLIVVSSGLPAITAAVNIEGNTGGATRVEINGNFINATGLTLTSSASRSAIRRLVVSRFNGIGINLSNSSFNKIEGCFIGTDATGTIDRGNSSHGIRFTSGSNNRIGGTTGTTPGGSCTGVCNLISGNNGNGIDADALGGTANGNVIQGNFIGTNVSGTGDLGNSGRGITFLNAVNNTLIGGPSANARNLISGNNDLGVFFSAAGTNGNVVQGNYIGVNTTATAKIPNSVGVVLFFTATRNSIIGNVISGNVKRGIEFGTISGPTAPPHDNIVQGNFIGTDPTGTLNLGNGQAGITVEPVGGIVLVSGAYNNDIGGTGPGEGNVIAFNYGAGIRLGVNDSYPAAGVGNAILGNSIYSNNGLGIALGDGTGIMSTPLANDLHDTDTGANNRQNHPSLDNATSTGGTVTVTGVLHSIPSTSFRIEFFVNNSPDTSMNGEGQTFVGAQTVTTNDTGNAPLSFNYTRVIGKTWISATATNEATGDTSEFSTRAFDPSPQSDAPVVTANDAAGNVNQAITVTATFTDGDGVAPYSATIDCGNSTQASGVTVNAPGANPGTVSGTCTYTSAGSFTATVTVSDNAGVPGSDTATVTVNAPPIANNDSLTTNEDTAANGTLTGSDLEGSSLTFEIVGNPGNGTISNFDSATGGFTYTPNANANGSDSFTFRVSDGQATSGAATISITINPVNDAPVADAQSPTTNEDTAKSITLSASDVESDPLTYTIVSGPGNGTLSGTGANVTYTPNANYNGSDSFTFKVNDGQVDSAAATVSITVDPVNDAPAANGSSASTDEDTELTGTVSGSDLENDMLMYSITTAPAHGEITAFNEGTGSFTYRPAENYNGADSFTFTVTDGQASSAPGTVTITIDPVNDAPVADSGAMTTDEDTPELGTLSGADVEGSPLTFTIVSGPTKGAIKDLNTTTGSFTYTPNADANGSDSFTYTASDGTATSDAATVSITINPVNDAPIANAQSVTVDEDSSASVTLTGSDIDNDALTFAIVTQPANGTVSGTGATVTYTPNANYSGPDSFTFKANDGTTDSSPATVSITVNDVAEPSPSPSPSDSPSPSASPSPSPAATPGRAINISTRLQVGTGENAMIGGFIITGTANKRIIIRGMGPSLAKENVPGPLADPVLSLHGPDGSLIVSNDNWKDAQQSTIEATQLAPENDLESAIVATLAPGPYTAIVTGRGNTTGAALVEIYDLDSPAESGLSNISTRGMVQPGEGRMIGGFMLDVDNTGSEIVVRALGPSLTADGINTPLADPTLDLRNSNGDRLVFNDDWSDDAIDAAAVTSLGLAPTAATESAIAVSLPPGAYTAIVEPANNTGGVALVEIYVVR